MQTTESGKGFEIPKLNEKQFSIWKVKIKFYMRIKGLEHTLMENSTATPEEDSLALGYIIAAAPNHLVQHLDQDFTTAFAAYKELCRNYEPDTTPRVLAMETELRNAKPANNESPVEFLQRQRQRFCELKALQPLLSEYDVVLYELTKLPVRFNSQVSELMKIKRDNTVTPLTFTLVTSEINHAGIWMEIQEKNQPPSTPAFSAHMSAAARPPTPYKVKFNGPSRGRGRGNPVFVQFSSTSSRLQTKNACYNCGVVGHHAQFCPHPKESYPHHHSHPQSHHHPQTQTQSAVAAALAPRHTSAQHIAFTSTTVAHYKNVWIVDSGAEAHVCNNEGSFTSLAPGQGAIVFGNGASVPADGSGTVNLDCTLLIDSVFTTPQHCRDPD